LGSADPLRKVSAAGAALSVDLAHGYPSPPRTGYGASIPNVGFGVPYVASAVLYGVVLGAVYLIWWKCERTLSIHSVDTLRRELFYWAAVIATFALGTAAGDVTAMTIDLGYFFSIVLFAVVILVPVVGYRRFSWNPISGRR
jgi:uncharacterized membrane-anchored protein